MSSNNHLEKPVTMSEISFDHNAVQQEYFSNAVNSYCVTMLGEPCSEVKGCGITGVCPSNEICQDNPNLEKGFECVSNKTGCQNPDSCPSNTKCIPDVDSLQGFKCLAGKNDIIT